MRIAKGRERKSDGVRLLPIVGFAAIAFIPARIVQQRSDKAPDGCSCRRVAVHEVLEERHVVVANLQLASRGLAVTARTPNLLCKMFKALGWVVVIDVADVSFVDAHPERDRGDNDHPIRVEKRILYRSTTIRIEPGVISLRVETGLTQNLCNAFRRTLKRDVHDRRACGPRPKTLDQGFVPTQSGCRREPQC